MRVKQHQQILWLGACRHIGPDIAVITQNLAVHHMARERALRHIAARLDPRLLGRLRQLQHRAALEPIDRLRGQLRWEGMRIEWITLQRGQNHAALLGGIRHLGHIGRQGIAQPRAWVHDHAGPPHITATQLAQRVVVTAGAAKQPHIVVALVAPQEGNEQLAALPRLHQRRALLLHLLPERIGALTLHQRLLQFFQPWPHGRVFRLWLLFALYLPSVQHLQ